jgi:transcriptional regulator with XRE-family HTH domain
MWLKNYRKKIGITQTELAKKVGISQNFYSMLENHGRKPSTDVAQAIAKELNFDWTLFYSLKE